MSTHNIQISECMVVENEIQMTFIELCHASNAPQDQLIAWIHEGILNPVGQSPDDWRFMGNSLRRAKLASKLAQDLEINTPGVAMVLELLEEIERLRNR